jgi:hypothetical protein
MFGILISLFSPCCQLLFYFIFCDFILEEKKKLNLGNNLEMGYDTWGS